MGDLTAEIEDAIATLGVITSKVEVTQAFEIRKKLAQKFSDIPKNSQSVCWQNLINHSGIHNSDGWRLLENYVQNEEVLLFINPEEDEIMWKFKSGKGLVAVLGECYGFPFCITSQEADYILCFDDHDCLIGSGKVKNWLKSLNKMLNQEKH